MDQMSNFAMLVGMGFKQKSDIHWARKIWHITAVSAIAITCHLLSNFWAGALLVFLWLLFVPLDALRLRIPAVNDFLMHLFGPVMRQSERDHLAGTSYLLTGVLLTYCLFPREIFMMTLLYLAFGDPIASIFGIKFGKDKIIGNKSLQGSLAAFAVCALITYSFLFYNGILVDRLLIISLFGGLVGALAEVIPLGSLDDNFSIPVVSAAGLWVLFTVFGGFVSTTVV